MNIDSMAVAAGFVGLAAGAGVHFWRRKNELQERCEFMAEMGRDLAEAFDASGEVLDDRSTPKPIRAAILLLLASHADKQRGSALARAFVNALHSERPPSDGKDPISQSMLVLGRTNPALARRTHHVLASLSLGLVFLHLADDIKIERIKDRAAKDPVSLWARIAKIFSAGDDHHSHDAGGRLMPA